MWNCAVCYHAFSAPALSTLWQALHCAAKVAEGSVLLLVLTAVAHHLGVAILFFEIDLNMACSNVLRANSKDCTSSFTFSFHQAGSVRDMYICSITSNRILGGTFCRCSRLSRFFAAEVPLRLPIHGAATP